MPLDPELLTRFHRALVDEIRRSRPEYLHHSFTVAEIYQDLVPYRTHRNVIGVAMNGDYEDALLRLLAGEGEYLVLESEAARRELRKELESSNPDTSLYQEFAMVDVRLNPAIRDWVGPGLEGDAAEVSDEGEAAAGAGEITSVGSENEAKAPSQATRWEAESDEVGADEEAAEGARTNGPEGEAEVTVADTGARLWAIEDALADEADHELGAVHEVETTHGDDAHEDEASVAAEAALTMAEAGAAVGDAEEVGEPCQWCGEALPDRPGMSYCPHCGGDVRLVPCPACGEALERLWRFCVACGTEVAAS